MTSCLSTCRLSEKQSYAPYRSKCHKDIDYPAEKCACAAEEPSHKVKAENTHKTPVKSADDEPANPREISRSAEIFPALIICSHTEIIQQKVPKALQHL